MAQNNPQQQGKGTKDDVRSAPESGDPKATSRQQGRTIDDKGSPSRKDAPVENDLESGRHGTK